MVKHLEWNWLLQISEDIQEKKAWDKLLLLTKL